MLHSVFIYCSLIILLSSTAYGRRHDCPSQLPSTCLCDKFDDEYIGIICRIGKDETQIMIGTDVRDGYDYVKVYCRLKQNTSMNELIPALQLGVRKRVEIELSCPVGETATIENYFDRFGVTAVTDLILDGYNSHKLTKEIFAGASTIVNLDLNGNGIRRLPLGVFGHLKNLTSIDLSRNYVDSLPEQLFSSNKKLQTLLFNSNGHSVKGLALPNGLLSNLSELESVSFKYSHVSSVPANLFDRSTNIKSISLEGNDLGTIPETLFSSQIHLVDLNLGGNNLRLIPANLFKNNVDLEVLDLSYNKLKSFPAKLFGNNKKLQKIRLCSNEIEMIPNNLLSSLEHLQELDLCFNGIRRLSADTLPPHITWLRLSHNQLEVVDARLLERLNETQTVHLDFEDNRIICECNDDFLRWDTVAAKLPQFYSYRCGNVPKSIVEVIYECKSGSL